MHIAVALKQNQSENLCWTFEQRTKHLIVKLFIRDQGSKNRKLARLLSVIKIKLCFRNGSEKIYFMWDPSHLLKSIRNNLMK